MVYATVAPLHAGLTFPESVLRSNLFAVLAAFVAINTVMYGALALAKMLPKVYPGDWLPSRNRRAQTRSIYPDRPVATEDAHTELGLERVG